VNDAHIRLDKYGTFILSAKNTSSNESEILIYKINFSFENTYGYDLYTK
jgi:hypothetical protein